MRVNVAELKRQGPGAERTVPFSQAPPAARSDDGGIEFLGPAAGEARMVNAGTGIFVTISGTQAFRLACARCLVPVEGVFPFTIEEEYREGANPDGGTYTRDRIDLTPLMAEGILLAAPEHQVCSEDCRGLCPSCGVNLNERTCDCPVDTTDGRWDSLRIQWDSNSGSRGGGGHGSPEA